MLRKLQMRGAQKLGLAALFLMAAIVIFFDIARIAVGDGGGAISLASLWNMLEPTAAVIISSLIPFRTLFTRKKSRSTKSYRTIDPAAGSRTLVGKSAASYELDKQNLSTTGAQTDLGTTQSNSSTVV